MSDWLGLPPDASAEGHHIDFVIALVHGAIALLFVGWLVYFGYVLVRYRGGAQPRADYRGARGYVALGLAAVIAVAELALLAVYEVPLWARRYEQLPTPEEATWVRVVGEQFAWNIHYAGPDGTFGPTAIDRVDAMNPVGLDYDAETAADDLVMINQMHVPVDRPVLVELTSKDVIHAFYLPHMRVKQDAIPGQTIRISFTPVETGRSEIGCAELCGLGHYRMRGFLTVQSSEEFESWYQEELEYQ